MSVVLVGDGKSLRCNVLRTVRHSGEENHRSRYRARRADAAQRPTAKGFPVAHRPTPVTGSLRKITGSPRRLASGPKHGKTRFQWRGNEGNQRAFCEFHCMEKPTSFF